MDFVFEFFGEIIIGLLGDSITSERISKWVRCALASLLLLPLATLFGIGVVKADSLGLKILDGIMVLFFLVLYAFLIIGILRSGTLRLAKKEDLTEILKMYRSVIGKNGCNWSISYPNEATLHEDFRTENLYILWRGKKMIGAGSIVPKNELDDLDVWHHREKAGEIARIVIAPEYQSKGYGKHLVKKLCYKLDSKGHTAVHLLVSTENHHALNLYREAGFHCMGQCERYGHSYYAYEKKL